MEDQLLLKGASKSQKSPECPGPESSTFKWREHMMPAIEKSLVRPNPRVEVVCSMSSFVLRPTIA
jgi:hypothetical protein